MELSTQKEQFSIAYVKSLAAAVGLKYSIESVDDDSIDITLKGKGFNGEIISPVVDFQVKATSANCISGSSLRFPLSIKNYDDLRSERVVSPRYLLVLKLPDDEPQNWLTLGDDRISLKNSCYWFSLRAMPNTTNTTSVTVTIPIQQRFTPESLRAMMEKASNGDVL